MSAIWRTPIYGFLGAVVSICATAACAEEMLVMPFRCSMIAGRPVLTPSSDEGYRILGPREQRTFSACSPVHPDTCKQWMVHRFELECGGTRVSWASVAVAADGPRNPRAWIEDGQVRVRMGPWWNMPPGDPCGRTGLYEDRWRAREFARYCAERRGTLPPAVVDMPAGFAPMLGTGGIFVATGAPRSGGAPQVASAVPPAHAVPSRPPPPHDAAKEIAKRPTAPPEQTSKAPPPALAAAPAAPAPPGTAEHPTIINRAEPPQEAAPPPPPKELPPKELSPKELPPTAEDGAAKFGAPALKQAAEQLPPAPARNDTASAQSIEVSLISMAGTPVAMLAGLAMIAAFTAGTFAWLRKHERASRAGAASREFASASLTPAQNAVTINANVEPDAGPPSTPVYASTFLRGPTWIPRNRAEALTVLGMGVTPDATQVAIKRIVDGLRLSWHPDHAKDEADRQSRESRLKQINAAWDILNGVRAEA